MKASVIVENGSSNTLEWMEYPDPVIEKDEILLDVKAAGINRADVFQRKGNYPAPPGVPADVPGMEVAGIVEAIGPDVTMWKPGDKVCALLAGGGYAQKVKVQEGQCLPIPENITFAEAASLPETVFTVWSNVFERGRLQKGESFLVHGGSSGIGITAIQLAKLYGCKVYTTVGGTEKEDACLSLGADVVINYKEQDFEQVIGRDQIDVVLDMIGGDYFNKNINLLKPDGRLVYINATKGNKVELNIGKLMQKRIYVTGSTLRGREYSFKKYLTEDILKNVWPWIENGQFKPTIYETLPLSQAFTGQQIMEGGSHIGKIILINE
ncbi:MAG: zinc-binding dehydrogenase [Pseudopedobacter saltans]|uniref:Zinc-binding dehydrogenase n=1 Tax=Pseudopedobacter saltans TaxID=151895 RepID=A0A2W5FBG7_9SPHI|nr:MAG: zinc-binding dehydrogenase [Pseudopedobacter saltans]